MPVRESVPAEDGSPAGPPPEVAVEEADTTEESTTVDETVPAVNVGEVEGDLHVHYHVDGTDAPADAGGEDDCDHEHGPVTGPLDGLATAVSWCSDEAHTHVRPFTVAVLLLAVAALATAFFPLEAVLNVATLVGLVLNFVYMLAKTSPDDTEDDLPERRRTG